MDDSVWVESVMVRGLVKRVTVKPCFVVQPSGKDGVHMRIGYAPSSRDMEDVPLLGKMNRVEDVVTPLKGFGKDPEDGSGIDWEIGRLEASEVSTAVSVA